MEYTPNGEQGTPEKPTFFGRFRAWSHRTAHGPYATPALFFLALSESVFFPIPVDVFLIPLAMLRARHWSYYVAIATIASALGGVLGWLIGFFLFKLIGSHIVAFYHLEASLAVVERWFATNVLLASFVSAFTPIPYKVFTIAAGLFHAPLALFFVASLVGRSLRFALVGYAAHRWGARAAELFVRNAAWATLFLVVLALLVWWLMRLVF